jgi:tRNA uracil 4-sulfurtransferase
VNYDTVIVRYGEIFLKGDYVRRQFTDRLAHNIGCRLKNLDIDGQIVKGRHRIFIRSNRPFECAKCASRVFGVASVSLAQSLKADYEMLKEHILEYAGNVLEGGSFAIRCRREKSYPVKSVEMEAEIGGLIRARYGNSVNLSNPDVKVEVEVLDGNAYVFHERIQGLGGLPYGTQGLVAGIIDCEYDALALWMMMRRGCMAATAGSDEFSRVLENFAAGGIPHYENADGINLKSGVQGLVLGETIGNMRLDKDLNSHIPVFRPLIGLCEDSISELMKHLRA